MHIWDVLNVNENQMKLFLKNIQRYLNHVFLQEQLKITGVGKPHAKTVSWSDDTRKCVERYCELANKKVEQLYKVSSLCLDDHQFKQEELESVGELSQVCSQNVLKCLYLARMGRPDILWLVNKLARAATKWTQGCGGRLGTLISYIHHTNDYRHYCHVGNTALSIRFVSRLRLCGRPSGLKIYFWESLMKIREAEDLSPSVGCARNKRKYPIVLQNLKSFLLMLDCAWMDYVLSTFGTS